MQCPQLQRHGPLVFAICMIVADADDKSCEDFCIGLAVLGPFDGINVGEEKDVLGGNCPPFSLPLSKNLALILNDLMARLGRSIEASSSHIPKSSPV